MPEGHSVHRIARQFGRNFVGHVVRASSPQGRFAAGAAEIDGSTLRESRAVGKQMFLRFDEDLWVRVHLGIYGAWEFSGAGSAGASRRRRLRMAEAEQEQSTEGDWPPEPIGQVRLRLLTEESCADLRGPTACEVLRIDQVNAVLARLGPDPLNDDSTDSADRFVAAVRRRKSAIALLLMDQSVVSGIGNVYRAEMLFRAQLHPHTPGAELPDTVLYALWEDWVKLLRIGVEVGQMMTMDGLTPKQTAAARARRSNRHWVYKREGLPCRVCGTNIVLEELANRKLYWCPTCQRAPRRRPKAQS